ncbi:MAG: HEAT repeat domain-containing protein [Deltaproteobacteria bacterium]|nr:HEAT repeat domain-containing protein [Deltaproteobacteria bacterium]
MFLYILLGVSTFIIGRAVRDALFLSRFNISFLPYMYIFVAIVVSISALVYSRYIRNFKTSIVIMFIDLLFSVIFFCFWLSIKLNLSNFVYPALYVFVEIAGSLIIVPFWTYANEIFTSREAKRLFGIIGAGGVLANVVAGGVTKIIVHTIGTENLLLVCSSILLISSGLIFKISQKTYIINISPLQEAKRQQQNVVKDIVNIFSEEYTRKLAFIVIVMAIVITSVDYQFKILAKNNFTKENLLTEFLAMFVFSTGIIACIIQFFVTGRFVNKYGIFAALFTLPLFTGIGITIFIFYGTLLAIGISQASNYMFRYTIWDSTFQMLYIPIPPKKRNPSKAIIDGVFKQLSNGLAGLILIFLLKGPKILMLGLMVLMSLAWIFLLFKLRKNYMEVLFDSLQKKRIDLENSGFSINDEKTIKQLEEILNKSSDKETIISAMDLIQYARNYNWINTINKLLTHQEPEIRKKAIMLYAQWGWGIDISHLINALNDKNEEVVAEAINSACIIMKERAINLIGKYLTNKNPMIRSYAIAGLIKYGGLDGILKSAEQLKKMLESTDNEERKYATRALKIIGSKNFYQPLFKLLADSDIEIQKEAIRAACEIKSIELLPALIYKLQDKQLSSVLTTYLPNYGDEAIDTLGKVAEFEGEKLSIREKIPKILAGIKTQKALDKLIYLLHIKEEFLLLKISIYISKLVHENPSLRIDERLLFEKIREINKTISRYLKINDMFNQSNDILLTETIKERIKTNILISLRLLEAIYPAKQISTIIFNLDSSILSRRANAIEAIDNMFGQQEIKKLTQIMEYIYLDGKKPQWGVLNNKELNEKDLFLKHIFEQKDYWLSFCLINVISAEYLMNFSKNLEKLFKESDDIIREAILLKIIKSSKKLLSYELITRLKHYQSDIIKYLEPKVAQIYSEVNE